MLANSPINATLRPCRDESVDFDITQNLYIEGDNLDVLKCLKETYLGKVKMIYIDPPYNTGNDFVYEDDFAESSSEYLANSGQYDEQGNRLVTNSESNGRFHTDWLNMIYPRLKVARDLLTEDGVIFISIDDNEVENLKKVCDEIFGVDNYINLISVNMKTIAGASGGGEDKRLKKNCEFVLVYTKNYQILKPFSGVYFYTEIFDVVERYRKEKKTWHYTSVLVDPGEKKYIGSTVDGEGNEIKIYQRPAAIIKSINQIVCDEGISEKEVYYKYGTSIFEAKDAQSSIRGRIIDAKKRYSITDDVVSIEYVPKTGKSKGLVYEQFYKGDKCRLFAWLRDISEVIDGVLYKKDSQGTYWDFTSYINNLSKEGDIVFPNGKKPVALIERMIKMQTDENSIIIDFFSGSATTAHAVMQLNAEDGGNRKFIMVQLPEITYESKTEKYIEDGIEKERYIVDKTTSHPIIVKDSEARKAGYWTICDIGKERIRRAGKKIQEELASQQKDGDLFSGQEDKKAKLDIGFRVLKLDSSNMEDVYYAPSEYSQDNLFGKTENVKPDRTAEDLLFQVMLELGATLDSKIEQSTIAGKTIFNVADNYLVACFDAAIDDAVVTAIAKMQPQYAVFRNSSMADDSTATNFEQIFKTYSAGTTTKVL